MAVIKDIDLWHEYSKSVKKLDTDERVVMPRGSASTERERNGARIGWEYAMQMETLTPDHDHQTSFQVIKLNRRERKNFVGEATIDLHGLSRNISPILIDFCLKCLERNVKNIVIISGKGEGILKNAVLEWLIANSAIVIGFFEIRDASGGSGSFGVRLRGKVSKWMIS
jgi:DNA-nicking Smr family endonuclease